MTAFALSPLSFTETYLWKWQLLHRQLFSWRIQLLSPFLVLVRSAPSSVQLPIMAGLDANGIKGFFLLFQTESWVLQHHPPPPACHPPSGWPQEHFIFRVLAITRYWPSTCLRGLSLWGKTSTYGLLHMCFKSSFLAICIAFDWTAESTTGVLRETELDSTEQDWRSEFYARKYSTEL